MTIKRVKDPEHKGRRCFRNMATETVHCGASAMQHALEENRKSRRNRKQNDGR